MRVYKKYYLLSCTLLMSGCFNDVETTPLDKAAALRGGELIKDCQSCHKLNNRANFIGPHLVGVYGREVASVSDYEYSEALKSQSFTWTSPELVKFIQDPTETYPGTMMAYGGISEADALDIVEYLRSEKYD